MAFAGSIGTGLQPWMPLGGAVPGPMAQATMGRAVGAPNAGYPQCRADLIGDHIHLISDQVDVIIYRIDPIPDHIVPIAAGIVPMNSGIVPGISVTGPTGRGSRPSFDLIDAPICQNDASADENVASGGHIDAMPRRIDPDRWSG